MTTAETIAMIAQTTNQAALNWYLVTHPEAAVPPNLASAQLIPGGVSLQAGNNTLILVGIAIVGIVIILSVSK